MWEAIRKLLELRNANEPVKPKYTTKLYIQDSNLHINNNGSNSGLVVLARFYVHRKQKTSGSSVGQKEISMLYPTTME